MYVFNPGLGFEWDFRDRASTSGFSPLLKVAWLQDCDDRPVYVAMGGVRIQHVYESGFILGGSFAAGVVDGEEWDTGERNTTLSAIPMFELGHTLGDDAFARIAIAYVPPNSALSATDNDGLLFFAVAAGFTLFGDTDTSR